MKLTNLSPSLFKNISFEKILTIFCSQQPSCSNTVCKESQNIIKDILILTRIGSLKKKWVVLWRFT